jgi:hypothetical protein
VNFTTQKLFSQGHSRQFKIRINGTSRARNNTVVSGPRVMEGAIFGKSKKNTQIVTKKFRLNRWVAKFRVKNSVITKIEKGGFTDIGIFKKYPKPSVFMY